MARALDEGFADIIALARTRLSIAYIGTCK